MRTLDGARLHLTNDARITLEGALKNAGSPNNLRLRVDLGVKAETKPSDAGDDVFASLHLIGEE